MNSEAPARSPEHPSRTHLTAIGAVKRPSAVQGPQKAGPGGGVCHRRHCGSGPDKDGLRAENVTASPALHGRPADRQSPPAERAGCHRGPPETRQRLDTMEMSGPLCWRSVLVRDHVTPWESESRLWGVRTFQKVTCQRF